MNKKLSELAIIGRSMLMTNFVLLFFFLPAGLSVFVKQTYPIKELNGLIILIMIPLVIIVEVINIFLLVFFFQGVLFLYLDWRKHLVSDDELQLLSGKYEKLPIHFRVIVFVAGIVAMRNGYQMTLQKMYLNIEYILATWMILIGVFLLFLGIFYQIKKHRIITTYLNTFNILGGIAVSPIFVLPLIIFCNKQAKEEELEFVDSEGEE